MTSINVSLEGLAQLTGQLIALGADAEKVVLGTITALTIKTQAEAKLGIGRGTKSGRTYRRGGVTHQASAPGQYPATDTGRLLSSVNMILPTSSRMVGTVGTDVIYGRHLEFGTSRMAARPWLMPSFAKAKIGVEQELKRQIEARL